MLFRAGQPNRLKFFLGAQLNKSWNKITQTINLSEQVPPWFRVSPGNESIPGRKEDIPAGNWLLLFFYQKKKQEN